MRPLSARSSRPRSQALSLTRGSWISLFAMLMIFIGPLISQSMPMDQRMPASMNMSMSMDMGSDMSAMEHADHDAQPVAEHCRPTAEHHALWEKCGYCSLLFNCPALTGGVSFANFVISPVNTFTTPSPRLGHARQTFFPGARTRAPPVVAKLMKGFVCRHDGYRVTRNRLNKHSLHTAGVRINTFKKQHTIPGWVFIEMPRFQIREVELSDGLLLKQIAQTVCPRTHVQRKASHKNRDQQRYHSDNAKNPHGTYAAGKKRRHFGIGIEPAQTDDNRDVEADR